VKSGDGRSVLKRAAVLERPLFPASPPICPATATSRPAALVSLESVCRYPGSAPASSCVC
jgi:hypothetical protein